VVVCGSVRQCMTAYLCCVGEVAASEIKHGLVAEVVWVLLTTVPTTALDSSGAGT